MSRSVRLLQLAGFLYLLPVFFLSEGKIPSEDRNKVVHSVFAPGNRLHFSKLLHDPEIAPGELIVGGREALYRLDVETLEVIEEAVWESPIDTKNDCVRIKGKSVEACQNYITVMLRYKNGSLLACGTNSYQPKCTLRKGQDLNQVLLGQQEGDGKSPTSKNTPVAAYTTANGDMYFASAFPSFGGQKLGLYRFSSEIVPWSPRLLKTNGNWFADEAQFVEIFEYEPMVYFFFREESSDKQRIYSRIGRVCQNDIGDPKAFELEKYHWTTFQKARVECAAPPNGIERVPFGDFTSYFDQIEAISTFVDPKSNKKIVTGIFTTPGSYLYGSALCVFLMDDVQKAFASDFEGTTKSAGTPVVNDLPTFSCERRENNMTVRDVKFSRSNFLMKQSMIPSRPPVIVEEMTLFKLLQSDFVQISSDHVLYIFYVMTQENELRKYVFDPSKNGFDQQASLIVVWNNLFDPLEIVLTMKLIRNGHAIVIGTSTRVMRLRTNTCGQHVVESNCLSSGDPHCGWDKISQQCSSEIRGKNSTSWVRASSKPSSPEDYLMPWESSDWYPCENPNSEERCLCRKRGCRSPKCLNIAASQFQITNCSRAGSWSEWSAWSNCSVLCGTGVMSRTRSCTNPTPQFDGKPCEGLDIDKKECFVPAENCPNRLLRSFVPDAPSGSRFLEWGPWSDCTRSCGGGIQRRSRSCQKSSTSAMTNCDEPQKDVRECAMEPCPNTTRSTLWTKWVAATNKIGEYMEHRYQCIVNGSGDQVDISIEHEERYCPTPDSCHSGQVYDGRLKSTWTSWTACDGMGLSYRYQDCAGLQQRVCDKFIGKDDENPWSCWSDWNSCHHGKKDRYRMCLSDSDVCNKGQRENEQRVCQDEDDNIAVAGSTSPADFSGYIVYLVIGCILAFFTGVGVTLSVHMVKSNQKRRDSGQKHQRDVCQSILESRQDVEQNTYALLHAKDWQNGVALHGSSEDPEDKDSGFNAEVHQSLTQDDQSRPSSALERHGSTKRSFKAKDRKPPMRQSSFNTKARTDDNDAFS